MGFLSGLFIIGPGSKYAYFMYSNEDHVEFASPEEALRAVHQGAPRGFRYRQRLLDIDFVPWVFYVGPVYRVVYTSGRPASDGRPVLLRWTYNIPDIAEATAVHLN